MTLRRWEMVMVRPDGAIERRWPTFTRRRAEWYADVMRQFLYLLPGWRAEVRKRAAR